MSNAGPRYFPAIAEHSRCQPGRPGPNGVLHAGSPGLTDFQRAKSRGSFLRESPTESPAGSMSAGRWPERAPYSGKERTSK